MRKEIALHLEDVVFRYLENGKRNILDHVSLDIAAGTITVLMGSSGCGKSTMAAVAAGLYPENGGYLECGEIELYGNSVKELDQQQRAAYLSMMFQNPDLQFCMNTLRKEMRFCMENICVPVEQMDEKIRYAAKVFGMEQLLDQDLHTLSGGEKQKAALACLYVMESRCILLDECFANIDREAAESLIQLLFWMKQEGRTVIAIDHQADLWMDVADEIVILGKGGVPAARNIRRGNLSEHAAVFEAHGLFYPGECIRQARGCSGQEEAAVSFRDLSIRRGTASGKGWKKNAPEAPYLLEHADADFPKGRMTAVLGASGSGKTTTFLAVLKQHSCTGNIKINGVPLDKIRSRELYRQIGIVFQNPANQFITQNVREEVSESIRVWNRKITEEECSQRASELLERYQLGMYHRYSPYMLSQGQQRRLAVLSVLAGGQKILLLDEPTYGQDYRSAMAIMMQLRKKMEEENLTVIFITHDKMLAHTWADKIYLLKDKKLTECEVNR